jgi:hypothetical protein
MFFSDYSKSVFSDLILLLENDEENPRPLPDPKRI